ncbi:hypothetical protein BN938_1755 [Mucinivorans hirudinis]|uniref:Uncharacterized protein n=1 Tax=Mucinivorans hirudinis TaxID=1433126 RepID=A0A060R8L5_9BACT|nr:hypothetical protein BN938_1755 [Mucinivorans hirudinis]
MASVSSDFTGSTIGFAVWVDVVAMFCLLTTSRVMFTLFIIYCC